MTLPEVLLWKALKTSALSFRRQHPIGPYVADVYCAAARLVVEVDGKVHDMGDRPVRDIKRSNYLQNEGYTVVRVNAADVLIDAPAIAADIVQQARPLRQPRGGCRLPMNGEDFS